MFKLVVAFNLEKILLETTDILTNMELSSVAAEHFLVSLSLVYNLSICIFFFIWLLSTFTQIVKLQPHHEVILRSNNIYMHNILVQSIMVQTLHKYKAIYHIRVIILPFHRAFSFLYIFFTKKYSLKIFAHWCNSYIISGVRTQNLWQSW